MATMATETLASAAPPEEFTDANETLDEAMIMPDIANIIIPPPDLHPIIEKTAAYVSKVGTKFEGVILSKNQNSRKFDFLHPDNPFHSFYKSKLVELLSGPEEAAKQRALRQAAAEKSASDASTQAGELASADKPASTGTAASAAADAGTDSAPTRLKLASKPKPVLGFRARLALDIARSCVADVIPVGPADDELCVVSPPPELSSVDLEIAALSARFAACNGSGFLAGLSTREQRNPQFDFLRPSNPMFGMFQRLMEAFSGIVDPSKPRLQSVRDDIADPERVLQDILGRIEYERIQKNLSEEQDAEVEEERIAMALIDWHDFVVMRTVDFTEEKDTLPMPLSSIEEIDRALDAQDQLEAMKGAGMDDMDMDVDVDVDMDAGPEVVGADDTAPVRHQEAPSQPSVTYQKCPSCNELVAQQDMSEHVRICLLDPRWREQKEASLQKQRESNLIQGNDISKHLSQFARQRTDIFRSEPQPAPAAAPPQPPQPPQLPPQHDQMLQQQQQHQQHQYQQQQPPQPPMPPPPHYPMMPPPPMPPQLPAHLPMMMGQPPPPPPSMAHEMPSSMPPPPPKRPRVDAGPIPEAEFAALHPEPVKIQVQLPEHSENPDWNLDGRSIDLEILVMANVAAVKKALSSYLGGLPVKKQKVQAPDGRWMKDKDTLALHNIGPNACLRLGIKERGRKK